jgi:WS/DGAT/MGAT family acyltransferase
MPTTPDYAYERLTALDFSFLALEKPNAYMHVASTMIYDAQPLRLEDGGVDFDTFRKLTESALHQIPRYRQKLAWTPIDRHPVWVDDPDFQIDYHLRHTALPRPGSERQLKLLSARIMRQHLDRDRPLWEMWLVEGLEGDRLAVVSKVHHCMIDGVSGVDLMKILMKPTPDREIPRGPTWWPRPAPSGLQLLTDEVRRRARMPFDLLRRIGDVEGDLNDLRKTALVRGRAVLETLGQNLRRVSETPLNQPIGPHRRFDWLAMDIADLKAVRKNLGGSFNDVVLAIVTGAIQRFLERRGIDPQPIDFRVMAPVSVRSEDEHGSFGNRVSAWIVPLPLAEKDPARQIAAIEKVTRELKSSDQAVGADLLARAAEWGSSTLLALGARNATRLLPFNLVVTNVPGPQVPLYTLGARMLEVYPHVPLLDNLGLGIALMSYDGRLFWGFNADWDLLPDLHRFVEDVEAAFAAVRKRAGGA